LPAAGEASKRIVVVAKRLRRHATGRWPAAALSHGQIATVLN
jgi:hypothetical protein